MNEELIHLLKKSKWTNPTDLFIGDIIEYDMKDGGLSLIKEENLLPLSEIKKIESIPKGLERDMAVGKLRYSKIEEYRSVPKKLEELFAKYRLEFGQANDLEIDDIFSIKRDALFLTRYIDQTKFGNYINFREKHHYNIYFLLGKDELKTNLQSRHKTYEVYYDTFMDDIVIKGISNENIEMYHMDSMVTIIKKYLRYISQFDYESATKFMVKTIDDYKFHRLPIGFYREFNDSSCYVFQIDGKAFNTTEADISMIDNIDIRYNFNHILVPMLNMASLGIGKNVRKTTR